MQRWPILNVNQLLLTEDSMPFAINYHIVDGFNDVSSIIGFDNNIVTIMRLNGKTAEVDIRTALLKPLQYGMQCFREHISSLSWIPHPQYKVNIDEFGIVTINECIFASPILKDIAEITSSGDRIRVKFISGEIKLCNFIDKKYLRDDNNEILNKELYPYYSMRGPMKVSKVIRTIFHDNKASFGFGRVYTTKDGQSFYTWYGSCIKPSAPIYVCGNYAFQDTNILNKIDVELTDTPHNNEVFALNHKIKMVQLLNSRYVIDIPYACAVKQTKYFIFITTYDGRVYKKTSEDKILFKEKDKLDLPSIAYCHNFISNTNGDVIYVAGREDELRDPNQMPILIFKNEYYNLRLEHLPRMRINFPIAGTSIFTNIRNIYKQNDCFIIDDYLPIMSKFAMDIVQIQITAGRRTMYNLLITTKSLGAIKAALVKCNAKYYFAVEGLDYIIMASPIANRLYTSEGRMEKVDDCVHVYSDWNSVVKIKNQYVYFPVTVVKLHSIYGLYGNYVHYSENKDLTAFGTITFTEKQKHTKPANY